MNQRKLDREKLLFRYTNALERGDFVTVEAILRQAQHDAELEQMIADINMALTQELPAVPSSNHRYNHKDATMYQNPTSPRAAKLREMPPKKRFPYALAAAILAVILVGGLLITAKFGFDNQNGDNFGGASFPRQNETLLPTATPIASATPSPLNPIQANNATPTIAPNAVNPAGITATPIPSGGSFASPTIPYFATQPTIEIVLCEVRTLHHDLFSRPNGIISGSIEIGQVVEVLDITLGLTLYNFTDPSITNPTILWFFVRSPGTPVQGWLSSKYIELLSDCPYPTDADYIPIIRLYGTAVSSGAITLEPPVATAMAATEQTYYHDLSTSIAATMQAQYGDLGTASAQTQNDTDGDGLTDADELTLGTNPNVWDTDGDNVGDGSEIRGGTDPLNPDTDMDGVVDSQDQFPTIPNDPEATIAAILQTATAHAPTATPSVTPSAIFSPTPTVCNPTNPSRLSKGDQGRIIGEGRTGVSLHNTYGFDAPLIRLLDVGTEFEVIDLNAICVNGTNWYKIAMDGEEGWVAETIWVLDDGAASNIYIIEPLD